MYRSFFATPAILAMASDNWAGCQPQSPVGAHPLAPPCGQTPE